MLLEIRHVTEYHYAGPVRESVMELWMQPQKGGSQRLVSFELDIDPPARLFSYADSFGNAVYHFDVPQPHQSLKIEARAAVETSPRVDLPDELDFGEWDRLRSSFVQSEAFEFLQPHGYAVETPALKAFVNKLGLSELRRLDPLTALRRLNEAVYKGDEDSQLVVGESVRRARATAAEPEFMRLAKPVFHSGGRRRRDAEAVHRYQEQQQQQQ